MRFNTFWGDIEKLDAGCENCKFYHIIDSAYGYCKRYPPILVTIKVGFLKLRKELDFQYPEVTFNTPTCGEFKERS